MAEARYNRLDNQSPIQTQIENASISVGRSAHDFSKVTTGNAIIGAVIPIDCFDVVPDEDISVSLNAYLEFRNPTTRQLLNGFRVYFHGYFNDLSDLWEGADNWLDTGIRSDVSITRPSLIYSGSGTESGTTYGFNKCSPLSLLNYLGLPAEVLPLKNNPGSTFTVNVSPLMSFVGFQSCSTATTPATKIDLNASNGYFPADCAFAYQRNWRDYYANRNLLMKNNYWFPNNEKHFILSYEATDCVAVKYGDESLNNSIYKQWANSTLTLNATTFQATPVGSNPLTSYTGTVVDIYAPNLSSLHFRQFRGDRFTTALPFKDLIRGTIPVLDVVYGPEDTDFTPLSRKNNSTEVVESANVNDYNSGASGYYGFLKDLGITTSGTSRYTYGIATDNLPISSVTMNAIRELETMTVFKERQARISNRDSYYNGFIESQFGVSPKQHDSRGIYLGGFYQDVVVSPVTQTSESSTTPLGTKAGIGISNGTGTITNNFHTKNYGWIQIYMSIVPDVFYTQGKSRMFDKKNQLDMYFPIFNNLEPQAIKNKELYVSGTASVDDDVYAYEDRYAEYKSRPNTVTGFMALSPSVAAYDASRIMARRFSATPQLNNAFVMMIPENIDMSVFSVADEPPFDYQIGIQCRRVFPGPYTAIPGSMSSNLHA